MRLLNIQSLKLEDFDDNGLKRIKYSILSHRWAVPEFSYSDLLTGGQDALVRSPKVSGFVEIAKAKKIDYIWIDSLCINQESSAELSEAINRMYKLYRDASQCFVYLSDVSVPPELTALNPDQERSQSLAPNIPSFRTSEWFQRGWTLQELIAPQYLCFYDAAWTFIGERSIIADLLCEITRIPASLFKDPATLKSFSIAQKMSWAAKRTTSRGEDRAYSLLGLFDISMPANYGEGSSRAFRRLQEELIKNSIDQSIFAWTHGGPVIWQSIDTLDTLFAESPDSFEDCGNLSCHPNLLLKGQPYWLNNTGLQITIPIMAAPKGLLSSNTACLILNCVRENEPTRALALVAYSTSNRKGCYVIVSRNDTWTPRLIDVDTLDAMGESQVKTVTICHNESQFRPGGLTYPTKGLLMYSPDHLRVMNVFGCNWNAETGVIELERSPSGYGTGSIVILARSKTHEVRLETRFEFSENKGKLVTTAYPLSQQDWRQARALAGFPASIEPATTLGKQATDMMKLPIDTTVRLSAEETVRVKLVREQGIHEEFMVIRLTLLIQPGSERNGKRRATTYRPSWAWSKRHTKLP